LLLRHLKTLPNEQICLIAVGCVGVVAIQSLKSVTNWKSSIQIRGMPGIIRDPCKGAAPVTVVVV